MRTPLSHRERFRLTLCHEPVDRPPMDLGATDMTTMEGGPGRLAPLLGISPSAYGNDTPALDEAVLEALDIDIRGVGGILVPHGPLARRVSDTEYVNEWGILYRWNGHHYEAVGRPLAGATIDDLGRFPWPEATSIPPSVIRGIRDRAEYLFKRTDHVVCGRHPVFGVFELGCWMCGFDDFLYRLAAEPEFVLRFFDIVWGYQSKVIETYYGAIGPYLHFTTSGDDFGTQTGPFMSPSMFRDLIQPYLKERISLTRRFTDAAYFHHSCGSVRALLPALIDAGVDILNPIQPRAKGMEPEGLKDGFGDRLVFFGGVDTQWLLPNGTPDEVTQGVEELIRVLGSNGGYVLSPSHTLQEDVPLENILAMYRAVKHNQ